MPLQMSWENPLKGVPHPASYWKIYEFIVTDLPGNDNLAITSVLIRGWHDKDTYDAALEHVWEKRYELPPGAIDFSQTIGDGYAGLYAYAQATPEPETGISFFAGAITV